MVKVSQGFTLVHEPVSDLHPAQHRGIASNSLSIYQKNVERDAMLAEQALLVGLKLYG